MYNFTAQLHGTGSHSTVVYEESLEIKPELFPARNNVGSVRSRNIFCSGAGTY